MTQVAGSVPLSRGDERVLNQVFDPESSPEAIIATIDASLPADPHIHDHELLKELKSQEAKAIRLIEEFSQKPQLSSTFISSNEQIDPTKGPVYNEALHILSSLIDQYPTYASVYNNRAQLRRWRFGDALMSYASFGEEVQSVLIAVVSDLRDAIRLSSPSGANVPVSPQQAKLLIQSWTQLGAVFWSLGRRKKDNEKQCDDQDTSPEFTDQEWLNWDSSRLEEEGSRCFFMAGTYGSDVGRSLAVKTNPYARLCGGIVKEALRREGGL
jgi:hypothetical protein